MESLEPKQETVSDDSEMMEVGKAAPHMDIPVHLLSRAAKECVESEDEDSESDTDTDDTIMSDEEGTEYEESEFGSVVSESEIGDETDEESHERIDLSGWKEDEGKKVEDFWDYYDRAVELQEEGKYLKAIEVLNEAAARHPEGLDSLELRHELYTSLGFSGKRMKSLERCIKALEEARELGDYVKNYDRKELYGDEEVSDDSDYESDDSDDDDYAPPPKKEEDSDDEYVPPPRVTRAMARRSAARY